MNWIFLSWAIVLIPMIVSFYGFYRKDRQGFRHFAGIFIFALILGGITLLNEGGYYTVESPTLASGLIGLLIILLAIAYVFIKSGRRILIFVILPLAFLLFLTEWHSHLLSSFWIWVLSLSVGSLVALIFLFFSKAQDSSDLLFMSILLAVSGLFIFANRYCDMSKQATHKVTITRIERGWRKAKFLISVKGQDGFDNIWLQTDQSILSKVHEGDSVYVITGKGLLASEWYDVVLEK